MHHAASATSHSVFVQLQFDSLLSGHAKSLSRKVVQENVSCFVKVYEAIWPKSVFLNTSVLDDSLQFRANYAFVALEHLIWSNAFACLLFEQTFAWYFMASPSSLLMCQFATRFVATLGGHQDVVTSVSVDQGKACPSILCSL